MAAFLSEGLARDLPVHIRQSQESRYARSAIRLGAWRSNKTFAAVRKDQRGPAQCHKPGRSFPGAPARRKTRVSGAGMSSSGPPAPVRSRFPRAAQSVFFPEEKARTTFLR